MGWKWPQPPIDQSAISRIEKLWNVQLPRDYVECVKQNHGGHPDRDCFDLAGRKQAVLNRLLAFTGKTGRIDLFWEIIQDRLPPRVFPFASDPAGNYLCFDYRGKTPKVVFWDHERAGRGIVEPTQVCESFTDLLKLLYKP